MTAAEREYSRAYYERNKEELKPKMRAYAKANRHIFNDNALKYRRKLKEEMALAYGGLCTCCGEDQIEFLTIDHVNDDGNIERKQIKGGWRFYAHLRRLGWPKDRYTLLCYNCNCAKRFGNGACPHKRVQH